MKGLVIIAAFALAGCAATKTVTETATVPAAATTLAQPDPTLDAQCTAEPNMPPSCTQGDYPVSITFGEPCQIHGSELQGTWQQTYNGSPTVRCMP